MAHVSDIKLIRTDTTLDLSQKAEKGDNRFNTCKCRCLLLSSSLNSWKTKLVSIQYLQYFLYFVGRQILSRVTRPTAY
nr:Protein kinase superfamily protein [Ipomoea batatas]